MIPVATIELTPGFLERGMYFRHEPSIGLTIECNWCSIGEYIFSQNGSDDAEDGWMDLATAHLVSCHINELESTAGRRRKS